MKVHTFFTDCNNWSGSISCNRVKLYNHKVDTTTKYKNPSYISIQLSHSSLFLEMWTRKGFPASRPYQPQARTVLQTLHFLIIPLGPVYETKKAEGTRQSLHIAFFKLKTTSLWGKSLNTALPARKHSSVTKKKYLIAAHGEKQPYLLGTTILFQVQKKTGSLPPYPHTLSLQLALI